MLCWVGRRHECKSVVIVGRLQHCFTSRQQNVHRVAVSIDANDISGCDHMSYMAEMNFSSDWVEPIPHAGILCVPASLSLFAPTLGIILYKPSRYHGHSLCNLLWCIVHHFHLLTLIPSTYTYYKYMCPHVHTCARYQASPQQEEVSKKVATAMV